MFVFTSVGSADRSTGSPHFDSTYEVEKHIAAIGARATILAPVYFMENLWFGRDQVAKGVYAVPLPSNRKLGADTERETVSILSATDANRTRPPRTGNP